MTKTVEITVSDMLYNLFPTAVNRYNTVNTTNYTPIELIKKLAKDFIYDQLHAIRHDNANILLLEDIEGVIEFET